MVKHFLTLVTMIITMSKWISLWYPRSQPHSYAYMKGSSDVSSTQHERVIMAELESSPKATAKDNLVRRGSNAATKLEQVGWECGFKLAGDHWK
jgi:hypothetical protein